MASQTAEFQRLGVPGDWAHRYATMDFAVRSRHRRRDRQVPAERRAVPRPAPGDVEPGREDRAGRGRGRVPRPHAAPRSGCASRSVAGRLEGAAVVIWTTTPWTMPGNRARRLRGRDRLRAVRVDSVHEGSLARPGERCWSPLALLPQLCETAGIATHHVLRVLHGATLAGTTLRAPAARPAATTTTCRCCRRLRHHRAGHRLRPHRARPRRGRLRARPRPRHRGAGDGRRRRRLSPRGCRCSPATTSSRRRTPVCAALEAAGGLLARGMLVHSYPHSWRSKAPLIFRATPQWFIRMDGPTPRSAPRRWRRSTPPGSSRRPGRNRIGSMVAARPDWCISRQRAWGVPIPVFVDRATGEPLRDPAVVARIVEAFARRGGRCLVLLARRPLPGRRARPRRLRAGHGHRRRVVRERLHPRLRAGGARPAVARRPVPRRHRPAPRLVPVLPARSGRHARRGPVQGGAHPRLRARRAGPQDVEVARQRHGAAGGVATSTAPTSCGCG